MKKVFVVSLLVNGILGGWIIADDEAITFKTGKFTVSLKYRHLEMRYSDIKDISTGSFLLLPTVTVNLKNGESYNFIVYNRSRFIAVLNSKRIG